MSQGTIALVIALFVTGFIGSSWINPNVAKAGGIQSQGAKGEAVVVYREPLATQDLNPSGFPEG